MYLLDTVVLSELRKPRRNDNVATWIESVASMDLFLSVITIAEIERGIERQRGGNAVFAIELERWLELTLRVYSDRILPVTISIARRWGRIAAQIGSKELDLAIAATALEHGMIVVTRNVSDFIPTGIATLDPFQPHARRLS
jgi:predicted nucleic acid-binding protein